MRMAHKGERYERKPEWNHSRDGGRDSWDHAGRDDRDRSGHGRRHGDN
jgi:hypothetical protein